MADAPTPKPDRSLAIDAVKGIGILEVTLHHALGQGARSFAHKGDAAWTAMRATAWATNFAIPLFLLLSAMLLAGSLRKSPDVGRFVGRRTSRSVWPYVVWSLIYWLLRWRSNPQTFDDLGKLGGELLTGKASYHLYFMVILIQLSLAIPFVVAALRRSNVSFWTVFGLSLVAQFGVFEAQKATRLLNAPASSILWYVAPLVVGAWIGLNRERWTATWRAGWPALTLVAVAAGAVFTWMNVDAELGRNWNGLAYNGMAVLFRVSASLALLGAAPALANLKVGPVLAALGRYSLPIYLVHPAILSLFKGPRVTHALAQLPAPALWLAVAVTALSYLFGWLTGLVRVDTVLFGQSLPRRAKPSSVTAS